MKRIYLVLLLMFGTSKITWAQYGWNLKENAIWTFQDSLGLNFNNGQPDTFSSIIPTLSPNCAAAISNAAGNLLFYTSSETIWDKNGNAMFGGYLSGQALFNHGAPQGVIILPVIDNPLQYYVFTLAGYVFDEDAGGPPSYMWLTYTIVDMSLNGGLGAVSAPPVIIDSALSCHMTAVPGDDCNIWLMVHAKKDSVFKAYEITAAGISATPVLSHVGYAPVEVPDLGNHSHGYGTMQVSPDRQKLAYVSPLELFPDPYMGRTELFDFDAATGIVTNSVMLDSTYAWDMAFSSDNSKLYTASCVLDDISGISPFYQLLNQFDVSLPTPTAMIASKTLIDTIFVPVITMPMRLTPDGRIYYIKSNGTFPADADYLGAIQAPNQPGAACNNVQHAVLMPHRIYPDDNRSGIGCNGFVRPIPKDTMFLRHDTTMCENEMLLQAPIAIYYNWSDTSPDTSLTITAPGTYWVGSAISYCEYHVDTFVVAPCANGIRQPSAADLISVYPNPASDNFTTAIALKQAAPVTLSVSDIYGSKLIAMDYGKLAAGDHQLRVNIDRLPAGFYTVQIMINNTIVTRKLTKR
jgi:hypothetical protein